MTEHKFTDEEIIEGLNAYVSRMCDKCNVKDLGTCCGSCFITIISQGADLINRYRAEIERLKAPKFIVQTNPIAEDNLTPLAKLQKIVICDEPSVSIKRIDEEGIRAEAIKEFAERLKEAPIKMRIPLLGFQTKREIEDYFDEIMLQFRDVINDLVKEMTEEKTKT